MPMPPPSSAASSLYSIILQNRVRHAVPHDNDTDRPHPRRNPPPSSIPLAGIHDALSAKIFAQRGAPALFLGGFGVSASLLGLPDSGMTNLVEMETVARRVSSALRRENRDGSAMPPPLIVDGDTGHGGAANVLRTISALASAGAAAVTIEDQVFPKKCAVVAGSGVRVVGREEAASRVRGALGARDWYIGRSRDSWADSSCSTTGAGVWIVARTDCRLAYGFREVIERCLRFEELGAEIVYAENLQSVEEYRELRQRLDPRTVTMVAQVQERVQMQHADKDVDSKPLLTVQEIGELGYDLALFGVTPLQCVVGALELAASEFLGGNHGSSDRLATGIIGRRQEQEDKGVLPSPSPKISMADFATVKRVVGFDSVEKFEREFPCG